MLGTWIFEDLQLLRNFSACTPYIAHRAEQTGGVRVMWLVSVHWDFSKDTTQAAQAASYVSTVAAPGQVWVPVSEYCTF